MMIPHRIEIINLYNAIYTTTSASFALLEACVAPAGSASGTGAAMAYPTVTGWPVMALKFLRMLL